MAKGLVIRYFMGGYYLCDGQPPKGCENDGELYVGNTVKWFETWEEANEMRNMINAAYGHNDTWAKDEQGAMESLEPGSGGVATIQKLCYRLDGREGSMKVPENVRTNGKGQEKGRFGAGKCTSQAFSSVL